MNGADLVEAWRAILSGLGKSWVLFENGRCVVFTDPGPDLAAQATTLLREIGPAGEDSEIGDFAATAPLPDGRGWVVAGWQSEIATFVSPGEVPPDAAVERLGRSKRRLDAEQLRMLHVEDDLCAVERGWVWSLPFSSSTVRPVGGERSTGTTRTPRGRPAGNATSAGPTSRSGRSATGTG